MIKFGWYSKSFKHTRTGTIQQTEVRLSLELERENGHLFPLLKKRSGRIDQVEVWSLNFGVYIIYTDPA